MSQAAPVHQPTTHASDATGASASAEEAVRSLAAVRTELDGVQEALDRLDAGTYGTCLQCGELIADQELAADPLALRCSRHA